MGMANPFLSSEIKYLKPWHANAEELKRFALRLEPGDLVDYNAYSLLFEELKRLIEIYNPKIRVQYIENGSMMRERTKTSFSFFIDYKCTQETKIEVVQESKTFIFDEKELVVDYF